MRDGEDQATDATAGADPDQDPEHEPTSRGWRIAAIVSCVVAAVALGVLGSLLFFDGGSSAKAGDDVKACQPVRDFTAEGADARAKGPKCPPKGAKMTDGLVQKSTDGGFTMRRIENGKLGKTISLHVRKPDLPYIDIAHAQTHAALGQPVRVYTLPIDGKASVIYMEDTPLLK